MAGRYFAKGVTGGINECVGCVGLRAVITTGVSENAWHKLPNRHKLPRIRGYLHGRKRHGGMVTLGRESGCFGVGVGAQGRSVLGGAAWLGIGGVDGGAIRAGDPASFHQTLEG